MKWEQYQSAFRKKANQAGFLDYEIENCLTYAYKLYTKKLPVIYEEKHFSLLVGYSINFIMGVANSPKNYYREFSIPKKRGGVRRIAEPLPSLKEIQNWILANIIEKRPVSKYCKSFQKNLSIKDNAKFHKNSPQVLPIDIQDYFGSTKFVNVRSIFYSCGYSKYVSSLLANLCCLRGSLPQGAPTSPMLSNLYLFDIDEKIATFCREKKIRYTRYADDMTFSGTFHTGELISFVKGCLRREDLKLNQKKTRLMKKHEKQEVTGIVVNRKLQVPKEIRRKLRQEMYYIKKYSLQSHMEKQAIVQVNYLDHLYGIANHISFVNPNDNEVKNYIYLLQRLMQF